MSVIEEALEIADEAEAEIEEDAAEEGLEEEELEEIKIAKENVGKLKSALNSLKEIEWGTVVQQVVKFVAKNLAIGAILWAVNSGLTKLISKSSGIEKEAMQKKQKKIKSLSQLITDISTYFKDLTDWMQAKKNIMVDTGSGFEVPLPDVYTKYTQAMQKVSSLIARKL